jgi:hypothetical protein
LLGYRGACHDCQLASRGYRRLDRCRVHTCHGPGDRDPSGPTTTLRGRSASIPAADRKPVLVQRHNRRRTNGYVLGQEASGAFIGGLRYGDGTLYTRNAGDVRVFWEGPSVGFDAGADGARTMMLVYNLPQVGAIFDRFGGINGSAYFIGGFGMTALTANNIVVVPIRSGIGLRLGANLGYLKFTDSPTWNPF